MIRLLVKLGYWLDTRFPAKVTVTKREYDALNKSIDRLDKEISMVREQYQDQALSLAKALERLSVVETGAVHKEPVQLLIKELAELKAEHLSFKASMGFRGGAQQAEINAILNGEAI